MALSSWTLSAPLLVTFTPVDKADRNQVALMLKSVFDFKGKTYLKGTATANGSVITFDISRFEGGCFFLESGAAVMCLGSNAQAVKEAVLEQLPNSKMATTQPSAVHISRKEIKAFDKAATRYKKPLSINPKVMAKVAVFLLIAGTFWFFISQYASREKAMSPEMVRVQQEKLIKSQLVDPDSARFSEQFHGKREGAWCGWVNARNSLGGYTGSQRFIALRTTGFIESSLPPFEFEDLWASACR